MKEKMLAAITSEVLKYKECDPELLGEILRCISYWWAVGLYWWSQYRWAVRLVLVVPVLVGNEVVLMGPAMVGLVIGGPCS